MSSYWHDFIGGWVGGSAGIVVGQPFDTLKVRQQSFVESNIFRVTLNTIRHEGPRGFFKGMWYPILSAGAMNSMFFGVYGTTLKLIEKSDALSNSNQYTKTFVAGCAGGAAQLVIACPVDLVKIKLQTQTGHNGGLATPESNFKGPYDVIRSIYRQHGIRGCYKGLACMSMRDLPTWGLYVVIYDAIINYYGNKSHASMFIAGGMAGVLSWSSIIYLDVVKSRIQADCLVNPRYNGTIDTFRKCYREGGVRIFGRGWTVMAIRAFPVNGATFLVYEYCLALFKKTDSQE